MINVPSGASFCKGGGDLRGRLGTMRLPDLRLSLALSSMRRGRCSTTGDGLGAVMDGGDAFFVGAMTTAEEFAASLRAVPDDFAPAMIALGRQSMDGALETIKVM